MSGPDWPRVRRVTPAGGFGYLADPELKALAGAVEARRPGGFLFVGGCVRNPLMDRPPSDIDAAALTPPDETMEAIEDAGWRAVATGLEHGTATAVKGGRAVEITTARADVKTDGRRAVVRFSDQWTDDWKRRDFAMNALYLAPDGSLFDPAGGLADIAARRVRFIGDADARIREDYLRILRFYRFSAWCAGAIDAEGDAACARGRGGLAALSAERVRAEILKLLAAPDPAPAVRAMARGGVLAARFGVDGDPQMLAVAVKAGIAGALVRLAALFPMADEAFADALRLSGAERDALLAVQAVAADCETPPSAHGARVLAYRRGGEAAADGLRLAAARAGADARAPEWRKAIEAADGPVPAFPLSGADLLDRGLEPGPAVGRVLRAVEDDWIAAGFPADASFLAERLAARIAEAGTA